MEILRSTEYFMHDLEKYVPVRTPKKAVWMTYRKA